MKDQQDILEAEAQKNQKRSTDTFFTDLLLKVMPKKVRDNGSKSGVEALTKSIIRSNENQ